MSEDLEAHYRRLIGGFSAEERLRLPLDYAVYGESLATLVGSIDGNTPVMEPVNLAPLYDLIRELYSDLMRQLAAAELRADRDSDDLGRFLLEEELAVLSGASHRRLLDEYFFLINVVELMDLVRRGIERERGEGLLSGTAEIIGSTRAELVRIFKLIDSRYEQIQQLLSSGDR